MFVMLNTYASPVTPVALVRVTLYSPLAVNTFVKVLEPEVEERTTTENYTVFIDGRVRTGQWTHTGTETGEFRFDLSMVKNLPASYELEEGEEGYRMLQYGDMTSVTFYLTIK